MNQPYSPALKTVLWVTNALFIAYPLSVLAELGSGAAGYAVGSAVALRQLDALAQPGTAWLPTVILVLAFLTAILDVCLLVERLSYLPRGHRVRKSALAGLAVALVLVVILPVLLTIIGPMHVDFRPDELSRSLRLPG